VNLGKLILQHILYLNTIVSVRQYTQNKAINTVLNDTHCHTAIMVE
jgi:hypothetical protein